MHERPHSWDAVFWDVGGVIVERNSIYQAQRLFVERLIDLTGIVVDTESALATWRETLNEHVRNRGGREFQSPAEMYQQGVTAVAGESIENDRWWPLFEESFVEEIRPVSGAIETLEKLAERDVHLGVISDMHARAVETILSTFGIRDVFDAITTADDVGWMKPEPAIFDTALERAGVSPDCALMIGDRYGHDVKGAVEAGMWTVGYKCRSGPAANAVVEDIRDVLLFIDEDLGFTAGMHA